MQSTSRMFRASLGNSSIAVFGAISVNRLRVTLVLRQVALTLAVLTFFLIPASATWAAQILTIHAEAGFFSPGCGCSFAPEVPNVTATGTERSPILVGISYGHHEAEAMAVYGILGAFASTSPPDPTGSNAVGHHTAAGASWQDIFLISGGTSQGLFKMSIRLQGHLAINDFTRAISGVDFTIYANPFQGSSRATFTTEFTSLDIDEIVPFQYFFEYGEAFEIIALLDVFATANLAASATSDFIGTAVVTSAIVIDPATGVPATGAVIETGSGADYSNLGPTPLEVAIDIKPGSDPNSINPKSNGVIPVAILTTSTFDATTVDPTTVHFGATGTEAAPVHAALEDVNGDGASDMILHFRTQATGIVCGETSASLTGKTLGGQAIEGSDSIRTVPCK